MKKLLTLSAVTLLAISALLLAMAAARATAQGAVVEPTGPEQALQVLGALPAGELGRATAVGDVNGDGHGDLLVAAPLATLRVGTETLTQSGAVYLFVGSAAISQVWDLADRDPNVTFYHTPDPYTGEWLGGDLALGDLNADGFDDVVMGTPDFLPSYAGAATVFLGRSSITVGTRISIDLNLGATPSQMGYNLKLVGAYLENLMGDAVAVGDVNGDGYDDVIAGAPGVSPNVLTSTHYPDQRIYHYAAPVTRTQSGAVYVALGRSDWLTDSSDYWDLQACLREVTIYGDDGFDNFGRAVASGDLNGDGYDDIVVGADGGDPGAPLTRTNAGEAYVFWGSSTITYANCIGYDQPSFAYDHQIITDLHYITRTAHLTLTGVFTDDGAGYDLSAADLNGDGYDDLLVGAPGADPYGRSGAGAAYVLYGRANFSATLTLSNADLLLSGASTGEGLGQATAATDLNRDGYDDLLLGAPYADFSPTLTDSGALYALCGSPALSGALDLNDSATFNTRVTITPATAYFGFGPAGGDVDADGWPELLIGAPGHDPPGRADAGAVYALGSRFHLTPSVATIEAGQPLTYVADRRTPCDALDVAVHPSTTLSAEPGAGGSWSGATFSTTALGTWAVTATHRDLTDTARLTVTPGTVARVVVSPTAIALDPGAALTFTARAYNAYDYLLSGYTFTWHLAHGGGTIHPTAGTFTATLADGSYSDTVVASSAGVSGTATVTVNNLPPSARIAGTPLSGNEGQALSLDGTPSRDPNLDPLTYTWDTDYAAPTFDSDLSGATPNYTWGDDGTFTLALRATDDDGAAHITTTQVTIYNLPPTASVNGPYTVTAGETLTLTGSATDPGGSFDPLTYAWDLDDDGGFETPGRSVPFSHSLVGDYVVALRVSDDDGGQDTVTATVSVERATPAAFQIALPDTAWAGEPFPVVITATDSLSNTLTAFNGYANISTDRGEITPTLTTSPRGPLNGSAQIKFTAGVWRGQITLNRAGTRQIIVGDSEGPASAQASLLVYARLFFPIIFDNG